MSNCRNVLESIVLQEVQAQLKKLGPEVQRRYNLPDVVAFALNRLPAMYVTTQKGWVQSRLRASKELSPQVASVVKQALMGARTDPLRHPDPLPESEMASESRTLALLQEFLGNPYLRWDQVPDAVQRALANVSAGGNAQSSTPGRRNIDLRSYLGRKKSQPAAPPSEEKTEESRIRGAVDAQDFELYMQGGRMGCRNILENLVLSVARLQMSRLEPPLEEKVNLDEVTAYALNRLPPMYTTNAQGLHELRLKAKSEFSTQIAANVRQAIQLVIQSPKPVRVRPQFLRFNRDMKKAIDEVNQLLDRSDVTWHNILEVLRKELNDRKESLRNLNSP